MNLSDSQIVEMHELCGALVDDCVTAEQRARLESYLKSSEEARRIYFHSMSLSASLADYANDMQSDAATLPVVPKIRQISLRAWTLGALASVACVAIAFLVLNSSPDAKQTTKDEIADADLQSGAFVGRITGAKDCQWAGLQKYETGDSIQRGQHLELENGVAEITFDSGAQLVLEGPCVLESESAWQATLIRGGVKAMVPPQAIGFRVLHSSVEVVDLGTEFSIVADANGEADVRVLKGSVEVASPRGEEAVPAVLKENESRRFGAGKAKARQDFDARHVRLAKAAPLDRLSQRTNLLHWTFDEIIDGGFKSNESGITLASAGRTNALLTDGRWQKALHFDGSTAVMAKVPSLSKATPRTIAFWVRVPEDSQLSDSHAMVSWQTGSKKMGNRALQIGWNRNPSQGALGALRTDLGKVYAMGATSLRDGRWHHVAVVFIPVGSTEGPVHVTQYVDGRLEGTTVRGIKMKRTAGDSVGMDVLWLGRSAGRRDKEHFHGDMDELFVADRALSPSEIALLKTANQPPQPDLASASAASTLFIAQH